MVPKVLCILADGVEEIEVVAPVDILRRAGVEVVMVSPDAREQGEVVGKTGIRIGVDAALSEVGFLEFDALLVPGGPAISALREKGEIASLARTFQQNGKVVAGICAAPLLLKDAGLLDGRRHTAHYTTYNELGDAERGQRVIVDGSLVTSRGAGTAVEFGLALAALLAGEDVAREVADSIMA